MPQPGSAPGDGIEELCFQVSTTLHPPPQQVVPNGITHCLALLEGQRQHGR